MNLKELNTIAAEQGWSETTCIELLLQYIKNHYNPKAIDLESFLETVIDESQ